MKIIQSRNKREGKPRERDYKIPAGAKRWRAKFKAMHRAARAKMEPNYLEFQVPCFPLRVASFDAAAGSMTVEVVYPEPKNVRMGALWINGKLIGEVTAFDMPLARQRIGAIIDEMPKF